MEWQPNDKQKAFLNLLSEKEQTLAEINEQADKLGLEPFKTGTINALVSKGLVKNGADREVIVKAKRTVKTYKLVK